MIEKVMIFSENNSSQESQFSRKAVVSTSRNASRRGKVKKFNCKKGARMKVYWEKLHHMLTHHQQKMVMEECCNSRQFFSTIMGRNRNVDSIFHSMTCQLITKKCALKEEACHLLQILIKRNKNTIMWR